MPSPNSHLDKEPFTWMAWKTPCRKSIYSSTWLGLGANLILPFLKVLLRLVLWIFWGRACSFQIGSNWPSSLRRQPRDQFETVFVDLLEGLLLSRLEAISVALGGKV